MKGLGQMPTEYEKRKFKKLQDKGWLYKILYDLFEVRLYIRRDEDNIEVITFFMTHISKLTNNLLKGEDLDGQKFEFKSDIKFDYYKKKYY